MRTAATQRLGEALELPKRREIEGIDFPTIVVICWAGTSPRQPVRVKERHHGRETQ